MIHDDPLRILPEKYFAGKEIDAERFLQKAQNTAHLEKRVSFWVDGKISVLYSINPHNSEVDWGDSAYGEMVIIQVPVRRRAIWRRDIRKLANAVQRCILYPVIVILSNIDQESGVTYYKTCVSKIHPGKSLQISVMESDAYSLWITQHQLNELFWEFRERLAARCTYGSLLMSIYHCCLQYKHPALEQEAYREAEIFHLSGECPLYFCDMNELFYAIVDYLGEEQFDRWSVGEIEDFEERISRAVAHLRPEWHPFYEQDLLDALSSFDLETMLALYRAYYGGMDLNLEMEWRG